MYLCKDRIIPVKLQDAILFGYALLFLSGCTSIHGMQKAVTSKDLNQGVCPSQSQLTEFNALTGGNRRAYRDQVILSCIQAINTNYNLFKVTLQKEAVSTNLATDIVSLGLTSAAALTSGLASSSLAGAGAFVIGTGTAINKDVFYQQTLPALEASMDAKRDKILKQIFDAERLDQQATTYTLEKAGYDLAAYQGAGNIYGAIAELTATANEAAQDAKREATLSASVPYRVDLLPEDLERRVEKLFMDLYGLKDPVDRSKLDALARALNVPVNSTNFNDQRNNINNALNRRAAVANDAQVQALEQIFSNALK
jgi:hypothetical protein